MNEAVRQVIDRGYSVAEVSERLGVSAHSPHKWVKAVEPDKTDEQAAALIEARSEEFELRAQLKRTEEERDILKNVWSAPIAQNDHRHGIKSFASMYPAC
jgi:transposase